MLNLTGRQEIRAGVFLPSPLMNFHDFCHEWEGGDFGR